MNQDIFVLIEHRNNQIEDISYVMLAAAKSLSDNAGGDVVALLLGKDSQELSSAFATDKVFYMDHPALKNFIPDAYLEGITQILSEYSPRILIMGHTTVGMDIASGLSARLNIPLVSQCQKVTAKGEKIEFVSQICSGRIMAAGELPGPSAIVTLVPGGYQSEEGRADLQPELITIDAPPLDNLSIKIIEFIEPDSSDVDISKEEILIAVGRGLENEDDLELVEELAQAIGGTVCATRPIIDQGWLPITRQVGKSGKTVKPKLYLALGISGAPEHAQGMSDSELIIAINTDRNAPVFEVAKYGADVDMFDLISALTSKLV